MNPKGIAIPAVLAVAVVALYSGLSQPHQTTDLHAAIEAAVSQTVIASSVAMPTLLVRKTDDFDLTGDGTNSSWSQTDWQALTKQTEGDSMYKTKIKALYSSKGLYFLFDCEDAKLSCDNQPDNGPVYAQDAVEVFLWPNEQQNLYFEYELSPLGAELPLLVPNNRGEFMGWLPWQYDGARKVRKATSVRGGKKEAQAKVSGWTAEVFVPFKLLRGLGDMPPQSGTRWRANLCRVDHDDYPESHWTWSPHIGSSFHNFRRFGTIQFQ